MNRAVELVLGYSLRYVQIISALSLITSEDRGKLIQVETGEGKTVIVFMIATIKALEGYPVDVISSN
jgi:preprotein translocase subunit SecA